MSKSMMKELEAKLIEAEERAEEYYDLNEKLIAKVEELTAALKDIYKVTNDMQVMSIVMANLPQPKTIPAALKESE